MSTSLAWVHARSSYQDTQRPVVMVQPLVRVVTWVDSVMRTSARVSQASRSASIQCRNLLRSYEPLWDSHGAKDQVGCLCHS